MSTSPTQWYVTARNGEQYAELVGPFKNKADADAELELVSEHCHSVFPEQSASSIFSVEPGERKHGVDFRQGTLNRRLGYRSNLTGWVTAQ